jgi:hypothetical protein
MTMGTGSNLLAEGVEEVLSSVLSSTDESLLIVDPAASTIERLVEVASSMASETDLPTIRLLADERTLKRVMDDFLIASNAADLVEAGTLHLRTVEEGTGNALLVTDDSVLALVSAGERVAALTTDDGSFVADAAGTYEERFEAAQPFNLRTPALSRVRQTLDDEIGPESLSDFDTVLSSLQTARGNGDGLDEVTISLLVAAKNEILLYDISKWGEDVGIASKATFSRTKTKLEDLGLIDTEKVPIDVGRPRLRLKLGDDRLRGADATELAGVAQSILS